VYGQGSISAKMRVRPEREDVILLVAHSVLEVWKCAGRLA
jgi:hypothetical protein